MRKIHFYIGLLTVCAIIVLIWNIVIFGTLLGTCIVVATMGLAILVMYFLSWVDTKLKD